MRFEGKVAVVSGGANGIGWATAERLLNEGARVAILDREQQTAEQRIAEWDAGRADASRADSGRRADAGHTETAGHADAGRAAPPEREASGTAASADRAAAFACDVLDPASVDAAVGAALKRFGRIDVLAAVAGGDRLVDDELDEAHWNEIVSLNLHGPVRLIRACRAALIESHGAIVMVGSVNGIAAWGEPAYGSAKAGLSLLAMNLAVDLGPSRVRINVVAPGTVRTRVWDGQENGPDKLAALYPLGRVGEPADIAAAIAFLASDEASWITGITLPVDGGGLAGPRTTFEHVLG